MYVKDYMTKNPILITPDLSVSKAVDIMRKGHFHRLPVVNAEGNLLGLITGGVVMTATGSGQSALDIYELNYLLNRTKVSELMIEAEKVITISPNDLLEEAATRMVKINVLPVIDEHDKVVGIITEKDIFKAFLDLQEYRKQGTRFVLNTEDEPGVLARITKLFADNNANLTSVSVNHTEERGTEIVIKATGEISVEDMTQVLMDNGCHVTNIIQTRADGTVVTE